jgi:hypothetical protein
MIITYCATVTPHISNPGSNYNITTTTATGTGNKRGGTRGTCTPAAYTPVTY